MRRGSARGKTLEGGRGGGRQEDAAWVSVRRSARGSTYLRIRPMDASRQGVRGVRHGLVRVPCATRWSPALLYGHVYSTRMDDTGEAGCPSQ